jgi:hypothetical protein
VDKAEHQVQVLAGCQQFVEYRVILVGTDGRIDCQIEPGVAGQGELREDHQVSPSLARFVDQVEVFLEVGGHIPQFCVELGQCDFYFHRLAILHSD